MDSKETKIYVALLIFGTMLASIFVIYVISLMKQHRKNVILYREKLEAEINALENERTRFVKDLHDDLGPVLSSVKLHVSSITPSSEEDRVLQGKSLSLINEMLVQIHHIANNLMPNALQRKGLITALRQFADDINATGKIRISVNAAQLQLGVAKEDEIHIYRIIQESINNAIKHAQASQLRIDLQNQKDDIHINIADNGVGYDYEERKHSQGLGLKNILSRVELLDGELYIDTEAGKGTQYSIVIPNDKQLQA